MKSFKEYLTESKKVYEFKVKLAGDCPKDSSAKIKAALQQFKVASVSSGKSTPIQETQTDFPELKNVSMTVFDVTTDYPATSLQVRSMVSEHSGISASSVKVKSLAEEAEYEINHQHDEKSGKALLGTDYEASNNQDLVGEKHAMQFLKELNKEKTNGTQYTGVNDNLLASGMPKHVKETPGKQVETKTNFKNLFTKQVKVPTAKGVK